MIYPSQTETPMDTAQMFYGDESRHEEDAVAWMQALNAKKVANDWSDKKAIDVFESLLAEEKCAWKWWNIEMPLTHPTLDRTDWSDVRSEFKKRWPPLPEIEDDADLKREELEAMMLEPHDLGIKVKYRGQEIYSHIAFSMEAT